MNTTYKIKCHVCGHKYEMQARFLALGFPDAEGYLLGTCNINPEAAGKKHEPAEIRASWVGLTQGMPIGWMENLS